MFGQSAISEAPLAASPSTNADDYVDEIATASDSPSAVRAIIVDTSEFVSATSAQLGDYAAPAAVVETVTAVEVTSAIFTINASSTESTTANSANDSVITVPRSVSETVTAVDAESFTVTLPVSVSESVTSSNSQSTSILVVADVSESGSMSETSSAFSGAINFITEPITSSESSDSTITAPVVGSVTESVTAISSGDATALRVFAGSVAEPASATDIATTALDAVAISSETATATDTPTTTFNAFVSVAELQMASSQESNGQIHNSLVDEIQTMFDTSDSLASQIILQIENATALDTPSAIFNTYVTRFESMNAVANALGIRAANAAIANAASASDVVEGRRLLFAQGTGPGTAIDIVSTGDGIINAALQAIAVATDINAAMMIALASVEANGLAQDVVSYSKTRVALNDPFNIIYDNYSRRNTKIVVPTWFVRHEPDTVIDPNCLGVLAASPEKGASKWTRNDRWVTIGMYRDTGRKPANSTFFPTSWVRSGTNLIVTTVELNGIQAGDVVDVIGMGINLSRVEVIAATDSSFTVTVENAGPLIGNCQYRYINYQFAERRTIFKQLPSNKVLTTSELTELFEYCAPIANKPPQIGSSKQFGKLTLGRRFSQIYDHQGEPLILKYREDGRPTTDPVIKGGTHTEGEFINTPIISEGDDNDQQDAYIHIYDTYGLDINDPLRGPYFSSTIITRNTAVEGHKNNILRRLNIRGLPIYDGPLFDVFGNPVIGIMPNNTLVIEEAPLSISVDRFNKPVSRAFNIQDLGIPKIVLGSTESVTSTSSGDAAITKGGLMTEVATPSSIADATVIYNSMMSEVANASMLSDSTT